MLTAIRTALTNVPWRAYSRRYSAASTPSGVTMTLMIITIITVPKMAGKMPPSVFDSRGSSDTNSHIRAR